MGYLSGETMAVHRSTQSASAHGAPASNGREKPAGGGPSAMPAPRGDRIRCVACRAWNAPTNRFCNDCGHGLWEPCFRCRTPNPAAEKFCGSCGANLFEWLHEQLGRLDGDLEAAQKLEAEGHFNEVLAVLRRIAALEDSRLRDFASRASQRIPRAPPSAGHGRRERRPPKTRPAKAWSIVIISRPCSCSRPSRRQSAPRRASGCSKRLDRRSGILGS